MVSVRRRLSRLRGAVLALQTAWRARAARQLCRRMRAAIRVQRSVRAHGLSERQRCRNARFCMHHAPFVHALSGPTHCILSSKSEEAMIACMSAGLSVATWCGRARRAGRQLPLSSSHMHACGRSASGAFPPLTPRHLGACPTSSLKPVHCVPACDRASCRASDLCCSPQCPVRLPRRFQAMLEMRAALREIMRTARRYARRTAAAIKIQARPALLPLSPTIN